MHLSVFPEEFGAIFLAQVTVLAIVQFWRAARQASREELGNCARPFHDGIHLVLTALAIVIGLVLLIIWMAHPIFLQQFERRDNTIVPLIAFLFFVYIIFVIGIKSSHHTSGNRSSSWLSALSLFMGAALLLVTMLMPMFLLPYTSVPQPYQTQLALFLGVAVVLIWQFIFHGAQRHRRTG